MINRKALAAVAVFTVVFCAAALVMGRVGATNANQPQACAVTDPHIILSLAKDDRIIVEELLEKSGHKRTFHAAGGHGDQDIYGDIAMVTNAPKELVGKQIIVFEADNPHMCAEQLRARHTQGTNDTNSHIANDGGGFVFVELPGSTVVGFRPRGALTGNN